MMSAAELCRNDKILVYHKLASTSPGRRSVGPRCEAPNAGAEKLGLISQKTKLAEAIRYALTRWEGLSLFLDEGQVEIDNNVVERAIRPLALTRKKALFAGPDGGAEHWAVIASLIETCKLNSIDPQAYLDDVITLIVNRHPQSRLDELLRWVYPAASRLRDVA